eukprot:TRINITY_DN66123_c5_g2_i1.p2 TRINITY_DN66123_c5_g2~~TRINITY_DN66123_c5_g2_i1.p2  ORF type:complete len:574 (-),score=284.34 TRINITY_DN66123_c5_g2_i1:86-1807(-)
MRSTTSTMAPTTITATTTTSEEDLSQKRQDEAAALEDGMSLKESDLHADWYAAQQKEFKPSQRRVPSTPIGRAWGFGSLAARMALGSVADAARRAMKKTKAKARGEKATSSAANAAATSAAASGPIEGESEADSLVREELEARITHNKSSNNSAESDSYVRSAVISEANAERLAAGLCRMRGAALKLGQILSIQDESIIPAQLAAILQRVRDGADVMPERQMNKVLSAELGRDWKSLVKEFDPNPIAAASIGQVHRAVLHDGRTVAMKIQYPGVSRSIASDLSNLKRLIQLIDFVPKGLYIDDALKAAQEELTLECDYEREAANQKRFRDLVADEPAINVPAVIDELSTKRVLTTEMVRGVPIDRLNHNMVSSDVRNSVASILLRIVLRELFEFRFMQTDPNWSNFLFDPEHRVIHLIDFGSCRDYDKSFVDRYLLMVNACASKDQEGVLSYSRELGFLTGQESKATITAFLDASFIVGEAFASKTPYDFYRGAIAQRLGRLTDTMLKGRLTPPPKEAYTLHRKLAGAFLTCHKLRATIECRSVFLDTFNNRDSSPSAVRWARRLCRWPPSPP